MPWQRIQSASGSAFGTSATATFSAANLSSGNKIIAAVGSSWRDNPTSVTDGSGNVWTLLGSRLPAANGGSTWLYGLDVTGDGTHPSMAGTKPAVTVLFPSSNGQSIVVQELAGLLAGNTTAMIDGTPAGLSGTGNATGSPSYSSTAANEYMVCIFGDANSAATLVAASGLTLDPNNITTQSYASIEYGNSTGGAETTGFTGASAGQWSVLTVAFKLAAAPAATAPAGLASGTGIAQPPKIAAAVNAGRAAGTGSALPATGPSGALVLTALTISPTQRTLAVSATQPSLVAPRGTGPANATAAVPGGTQRTLNVGPVTGEGGP